VKSTDDVRQGEISGHVRWVLGVSLTLVIVAMAVVHFVGINYLVELTENGRTILGLNPASRLPQS
jgi:hypothetical protein